LAHFAKWIRSCKMPALTSNAPITDLPERIQKLRLSGTLNRPIHRAGRDE